MLCKHDVNGSSPLASIQERFPVYFGIALDRSGFFAYIIEPRDEEAETIRKRSVAARSGAEFFGTDLRFLLDKSGGRVYTKRCHPTGRTKRAISSSAPNLHKRIDEKVCRIAWVNEASTENTCAFDLSSE